MGVPRLAKKNNTAGWLPTSCRVGRLPPGRGGWGAVKMAQAGAYEWPPRLLRVYHRVGRTGAVSSQVGDCVYPLTMDKARWHPPACAACGRANPRPAPPLGPIPGIFSPRSAKPRW